MFLNNVKTWILIFGLVFLMTALGGALGNQQGAVIGFAMAAVMSLYSYWFSDKMVIKAYHGQQVSAQNHPRLYGIVQTLARRADLPMPKVYIVPEDQPNAFATGRNPEHAAVACTKGLLRLMNDEELSGVLGHELGHIKHRDILISTIAATCAGAISNISRFLNVGSNNARQRRDGNTLLMVIAAPLIAKTAVRSDHDGAHSQLSDQNIFEEIIGRHISDGIRKRAIRQSINPKMGRQVLFLG